MGILSGPAVPAQVSLLPEHSGRPQGPGVPGVPGEAPVASGGGRPAGGGGDGELPWLLGEDALRAVEGTAGCLSPLAYRDGVPEAVRRYKFPGNPSYRKPFGLLMAQCAQDGLTGAVDVVTWTPLSRRRKKKRGFDQAELLARTAAGELGLPARKLLEKEKDNGPQSHLEDEAARRANVQGVYRLTGEDLSGLRVLLVDDVVTTGSTMGECARLLLEGGASEVWGLTLAQARKK